MNNCDNKEGGSSSNIQTIEETTKLGAAVTAATSSTTTTSETTSTTTTNVDKPDDFSNNSNENLTNDTKCAENTNETPACVAGVIAPPSPSTKSAGTTVSYAAITAMDTASANAFISSQRSENSCLEAIVFSHCDKSSTTNTQTICDNESTAVLPVPELETTSESPAKAETEVMSGEGNRDGNDGKQGDDGKKEEDKAAAAPGLVVVNASSSSSSSSSPSPALSSSPSSSSSASSLIVNLENNKEKTKAPPPLENISTTSVLSALSGSTDSTCSAIATNSGSPSLSDGGCYNKKSQMLLQKKIQNHHTLTAASSEPILMQCGSSGHNKTVSTVTGSGLAQNSVITRRVSFPKSDEALVTGYLEPANPWEHVCMVNSISEVAELYVQSCKKHHTTPIQSVLDHLKIIEINQQRQPNLLLKNTKLMPADCEALEEIFKRVQYKSIDVSSCDLNEAAASALFDMFEYYEVTNELDISSNADGMTQRGWTSCIYMVSHSRALQMLNAQGNPLSKNCADNLGSALNSSNLHTIKLEHCGLRGFPLDSLCTKLRNNQILKELWLAHNDLTCLDADKIAQLLRSNHYLQLIDISNNNIKDEGLMKIVKALIEQSTELERQKIAAAALAFAISEAEHKKRQQILNSSNNSNTNASNSSSSNTTSSTNGMSTINDDDMTSGDSDASPAEEEEDDDDEDDDDEADDADVDTDANDAEDDDGTTTEDDGGGSRAEEDDDDEDTVKTSTLKTTPPMNGQSKLDKLLSMNNSDSSEEAPTDTVAASDISVSDDIFDSTNAIVPVVASTPIVEPALELPVSNNNNTTAAAALFDENNSIEDAAVDKAAVTPTKALDVNKNATKLDDFDDTHSTDSAFESSSDGDISRHLPDEFVGRFDNKDEVETAVIATEALTTPTQTPPLPAASLEVPPPAITTPKPIEVTPLSQLAASASPNTSCESSCGDMSALKTAALTGTSPSPASGMRRTESTCTITQSTRVRSHSSDSLSSDNSLDGSIGDAASGNFSTKINEKLTKNDTLTRQKQFDVPLDSKKTPNGLKALALWNNNLTKESGPLIADLLATTVSLELLNIGKNILCNDFVASIRDSLSQNTTLTTLGLQSAHLSCAGIRTLSSILQFGGNSTLQRIDIRDNKIEVDSLNMLAEALKSNTTVTQIDIDDEPKRLSIGSDAQLDYARVLENVRSLCSRNENQPPPTTAITDKTTAAGAAAKRRGGYYLGSRKISLTCHTAPPRAAIIDQASNSTATSKLEVKKKTGVRLRSPIPSPPTISPSSSPVPSPSKSRFQVFRVSEVSPLTSPMTPSPSPSPTPSPTPLSTTASGVIINSKDSTTTIKRLSTSPRSRFHVSKIYEDPGVPILHRTLPPITPSPSPPTAPSIKLPQLPPAPPPSSRTFEKQTIVTTPATPPIEENVADTKTPPSFAPTTDAHITTATTATNAITGATIATTTTTIANNSATDTKTNPNSIDVNNSTNNTVKPNDQVDASASVQPSSPSLVHASPQEEATKCQQLCSPPLPVVEDDQRTLTNSPDVNIDSVAITTLCSRAQYEFTTPQSTQETQDLNESQELQSQPASAAAARTRKTSWIPNSTYPGTVDRLLSMFQNPAHLFHRSSSPETISGLTGKPDQERGTPPSEADQQSLVPVRKRTPPSANQLPSWCKLGTEMCKPVTTAIQTAAAVSSGCGASGTTTAVVASVESPLSFFDAASKQFRQSIQVFRQNIAFGNEATNINQEQLPQQLQHDCDTIPSDMKLEIKENISPEHTINEEQLQSLQKIGGSPGSSSTGSSGTDTTEGASTTSSSPSSLLSVQLMGVPSTPTASSEAEKVAATQQPTPSPPPPAAPAPQTHVQNEEQSCTS